MLHPFYQDTTFFFIPYYWNNDNPCYNDTLRKERELSLYSGIREKSTRLKSTLA